MIKVVLSPDAVLDYDEAFTWYAQRSRKAALELEEEVGLAIDRITSGHQSCPRFDEVYQYTRLKKYPFIVAFRTEDDTAHIVAIAHASRSPGYWKTRDQPQGE